jgi:class 3 adenylate cyclase/tetratricopeptide (TPR) repeat protein
MRCPRCDRDDPDASSFCRHCGAPLGSGPASAYASPDTYTPPHLATKILTSRKMLEGERKQVTVLFADMKGSMELLAGRDPEDARAILDPILELMMEAVHRYEGTVNQVMGDGIMALFGAPVAHEDHAVRACYAALRMQEAVKDFAARIENTNVQVRIGLNSGDVVVRAISSDLHMDYTAVGQTTHLAARMEQLAEPEHILLTAQTFLLAEGYVEVNRRGAIAVKGLPNPVEIYELTSASGGRGRFEATAVRGLSRFIGRAAELQSLAAVLQSAKRGMGRVVGLVGEPGVGKSRLVHEFVHSEHSEGWLILESDAVSYGKLTPYFAVKKLLRRYFGIEHADGAATVTDKVQAKLRALDVTPATALAPLLALLDVPMSDPQWESLDPAGRRLRTIDVSRSLLVRESLVRPLVLVFDDVQWMDSESQAVLDSIVEALSSARILLLASYRLEYAHRWAAKDYYTELRIDPLPTAAAEELLHALLGTDAVVEDVKRVLIARTEGNPLFLEECVRSLIETRVLVGQAGAYRLARPIAEAIVPSTVQALLAARIDRLAEDDRRLLELAAVIGKDVPFALIDAVAARPEDDLRRALGRLERAQFLYTTRLSPELEYTFKHALTHEVAYQSPLHDRRRSLHARIVDAMEGVYAGRLAQHVERLAHHALSGERWDKAVAYAREAGAKALARSAYRESIEHFEHALGALTHLPESPATSEVAIDVRFELRTALTPLGYLERIVHHLREAERLALQLDDKRRLARVSAYLADYFRQLGEHDRALAAGERAQTIASRLGDVALEIASNTYLGHACQNTGQYRRAITLFRRNAQLAEGQLVGGTLGLPFISSVQSRIWLASCFNELGDFAEGVGVATEAIRIAETVNHEASLATACSVLGNLYLRMGEPETAVPFLERGYTLSQARNLNIWMPTAEGWLGLAYALLGRLHEGLTLVRSAAEHERAMRRLAHHSIRLAGLAECYLWLGQVRDAESAGMQALDLARKQGERGNEAHALRVLGSIAARSPSVVVTDAEKAFRDGITLADQLEMRPVSALCHVGLATLLRHSARSGEAPQHLQTALGLFKAMGARVLLERAQGDSARAS